MGLFLFLILIATLVWLLALNLIQFWRKQRQIQHSPVVEVSAQVITTYKAHRASLRGRQGALPGDGDYVVFELQTGERKTFVVEHRHFVEGMRGKLIYQGSRFLNFQY
jgi:Protein of unknown function (DUF2500)